MTSKEYDAIIQTIAEYIHKPLNSSNEAYQTARACLADSLGCAILALKFSECTKLLGPIVSGTIVPNGAKIPGTHFNLDPVLAAFNIGLMIRWLDYNDTWLAAEWGHPSDNLGGILAVGDYLDRSKQVKITIKDILQSMIQAYEIQGVLALENSFNRIGFDHVILVKVATAGVVSKMMGASQQQTCAVLSNAWIDTGPLRTYRHAPNTGSRKSWAAGDATSRGVMLSHLVMKGEMGYPTALTTKTWGFNDTILKGNSLKLCRPLASYVMENILFKVAFPAEFHAQTAVECAIQLHPQVKDRLKDIAQIHIDTHESAIRIIDKKGPLNNPADRDHCLQYMVAIGLLYGTLTADHYEESVAKDLRIEQLRNKMIVKEHPQYSKDYLDAEMRSIASALTITFRDGLQLGPIEINYPLGHRRRRKEGIPLLYQKCKANLETHYASKYVDELMAILQDHDRLEQIPVSKFMDLFKA